MKTRTCIISNLSRSVLLLTFIFFGLNLYSQNSAAINLSLEECIAAAKANNLQVQRQMLRAGGTRSELQASQLAVLPSLSGWASHNLNSGKTVNFENYSYINTQYQDGNLGIQASLPLFQGMQGWNQVRQDKLQLLTEEQRAEAMENQISIQVVTAYLQILMSEEMVKMAESKLQVSSEQLDQAEEFFNIGRIARSEVLVIKSQEAQDRLDLITRQGNLDLAYLVMRQLINIDEGTPFQIIPLEGYPAGEVILPGAAAVYDYAKLSQPRILAAQSQVLSNEAALRLAQGKLMPNLSLNGVMYSRYSELGVNPLDPEALYPYTGQLADNTYMRASINLNIPIMTRFSSSTQKMISRARVNVLDSKLVLEQEKKTMREEIQQAAAMAQTAMARMEAAEQAENSAREADELIKEQYKAGLATAIDMRVSGNQLLQASASRLQAKYELLLRSKILDVYLGK